MIIIKLLNWYPNCNITSLQYIYTNIHEIQRFGFFIFIDFNPVLLTSTYGQVQYTLAQLSSVITYWHYIFCHSCYILNDWFILLDGGDAPGTGSHIHEIEEVIADFPFISNWKRKKEEKERFIFNTKKIVVTDKRRTAINF